MAPILIDGRGLIKLGFTTVFITALIFGGGFLLGYQKAITIYQAANEIRPLSLPEPVASDKEPRDQQVPAVVLQGEDIDVDRPDILAEQTVAGIALHEIFIHHEADTGAGHGHEPADDSKNGAGEQVASAAVAEDAGDETPGHMNAGHGDKGNQGKTADSVAPDVVMTERSVADLSKAKYSIQVGMYGALINAENMMQMLQAQNMKGYISDYRNKRNELRYNVRFGYYADKKSALTSLSEYKKFAGGDGYLVRFSADKLVNTARAGEQIKETPEKSSQQSPAGLPAGKPIEKPADQLSQQVVPAAATIVDSLPAELSRVSSNTGT